MTTFELKKILIHRIAEIDDESFLNAIRTILDSKTQTQVIELTIEQKQEIADSKKQIENQSFKEQDELDKEFERWLDEK